MMVALSGKIAVVPVDAKAQETGEALEVAEAVGVGVVPGLVVGLLPDAAVEEGRRGSEGRR